MTQCLHDHPTTTTRSVDVVFETRAVAHQLDSLVRRTRAVAEQLEPNSFLTT